MANHPTHDHQPTSPRHTRKGSNLDRNPHRRTGHTNQGDGPPDSNPDDTNSGSPDDSGTRSEDTDRPRRDRQSAASAQNGTSEISEESRAYWRPIVAAMAPMTSEELADVAAILRRIDHRLATEHDGLP
ncbi:hypothetical protein [Amycolatopsis balhimycina]|uniref:hypothetical protein n=1 Tax=Amycolatopsis balhimycina TaxID=208443 RepID=UPI0003A35BE5|nr:hypothetical protein [Amycolatopsis balhimycina]